ncbi:ABC transporter ATP-binding protein [Alkalimarinus alittae]|uniref:ABC transporter ATP-binding protein/permease n=1 Tax=Alkalimarinus alittae TaxID=2961619 RepID=A0ABY6N2C5_9ALTE|nr:ABC transporter ATP-binding protein [Alkalimarinus alittae]UZE96260.1 ABC transporter ATP-binding protein/permease [Alkalimarinus alittae]
MFRFFENLIKPFPSTVPTQPPNRLLAFCRHYTRGMEAPLILMTILTAALAILEVALFGFLGELVDWLSVKNPETLLQEEGATLLGMGFLLLVGLPLIVLLHAAIVHQALLGNFPMQIRWMAHRYLLRQSMSFYQNDFAGRIATKVMQTSLAVREAVMKLLDVMVYVVIYFAAMLVLIAQADLRLMLPLVVWLMLYACLQYYFIPKLKKVATRQADARSSMTGRIVDSYTNIATVKLFSHSKRESDYAKESMDEFLGTVYQQMRLATGLNASVHALNYALVFSVTAMSIWLWMESAITVGAIAIAVSLSLRLNGMAQWIMWEVSALFENIGTVNDGMTTLSQPLEVTDAPDAKDLLVTNGELRFDQVCFHYGQQGGVIDDLNLHIKPGEKVGLVGRSGAGKSTLVNLLLRFHDLAEGRVLIDGQDIKTVTQDSLRAQIGMVSQDTSLLHRSVRDNILYGHPDATEEQMIAAAKFAEAHEFIQGLTDAEGRTGYDAQVGERGVKLSGGQRQRIAIARVLLKNAAILLLDEATSALDSEIEAAIQHSLTKLMEGKTVIAIAHRLSTIAAMDRLIVLDDGNVVEQGTHQELVASGGIYAQLWAHQSGGFIGVEA